MRKKEKENKRGEGDFFSFFVEEKKYRRESSPQLFREPSAAPVHKLF